MCGYWCRISSIHSTVNSVLHNVVAQCMLASTKLLPTKQRRNRFVLFALWLCKRKLEQIPFCTCQKPNKVSSSKLLPTKPRRNRFVLFALWLCKRMLEQIPVCTYQNPFIFTAATHKQRLRLHTSRSRIAQTACFAVHVQCTHSARYSARHSARPQHTVNTMG